MKLPLWLIGLLFAAYSIWAINYWHNYRCDDCGSGAAATTAKVQTSGEPLFRWNADRPEPDANFKTWKKNLLAAGGQGGDTLVITGHYRASESWNGKSGQELGLARAAAIRDMLSPELPANRVKLVAAQVSDGVTEASGPTASAAFNWLKMVLKKEDSAIIESDNEVIFLFPFNSTERSRDAQVEDYLKKLVDKHKASSASFTLTGHTDDVGTPEENIKLGLARANTIKGILTENGIAANRISTTSKGEAEPVAENSTDEGRQRNRRVVLTVNR